VLSLDPRNPASNDSLAMYWLDAYLRIPNDPPSADDARIQIGLLRRAAAMQTSLARVRAETDSLTLVIHRQNSVAATQTQRLLEAEAQLNRRRRNSPASNRLMCNSHAHEGPVDSPPRFTPLPSTVFPRFRAAS